MSIFKCKMCGGTIEFQPGETVGICDSCGTKQTLPKLDSDRKANLYDRANHFRRNNEFDKAASIYEQILAEDNTDAESYWSLVLCRYGIEYVEDPATRKRVPTVNRAQFTSIFDDADYKSALEYADSYQRGIYEQEAAAINEIQKGILAISQKEEPFDVFICYKETDPNGRRTPDSVLANDLYHQLTQEGFKVFFARITLEDKLGTAYEPYIFAALNSAKVMVVLGTKPEYFNAVWVKNEWSRYLSLVKNSGGKKVLIPAYRDMDPYDLPEEFSHLQAQDMSKLGFMQDLIRGIKKIVRSDSVKPASSAGTAAATAASAGIAPLLKRAFMFLEDGNWQEADNYCEKVLDQDPENAQAYFGKLMAELKVRRQDELQFCEQPFDQLANYQKAVRFADNKYASELENIREQRIYNIASSLYNPSDSTEDNYRKASELFTSISKFKDAEILAEKASEKAEIARKDLILEDTRAKIEKPYACLTIGDYRNAVAAIATIPGWKDSDELANAWKAKIAEIEAEQESLRIERERQDEARRLAAENRKKNTKKALKIGIPAICALAVIVLLVVKVLIPASNYKKGNSLLESGSYEEAVKIFTTLGNYKDSSEKHYAAFTALKREYAKKAEEFLIKGDRIKAAINFQKAGDMQSAKNAYDFSTKIAVTHAASAAVADDGTCYYSSNNKHLGDTFKGCSAIYAFNEYSGIVGINNYGGLYVDEYFSDKASFATITNIKQIATGDNRSGFLMLLDDGSVMIPNSKKDDYIQNWDGFFDIEQIGIADSSDYWAISKDGMVTYIPATKTKTYTYHTSLKDFVNIKKIACLDDGWIIGLTKDGNIVYEHGTSGNKAWSDGSFPDYSEGKIINIETDQSNDGSMFVLLMEDGTVRLGYIYNDNSDYKIYSISYDDCYRYPNIQEYYGTITSSLSKWKNIVYVQKTDMGIIGVDIFGKVYWQSTEPSVNEKTYKVTVAQNKDIASLVTKTEGLLYCSTYWEMYNDRIYGETYREACALVLKEDGSLESLNNHTYYQFESGYTKLHYSVHSDGVYDIVDDWKLW